MSAYGYARVSTEDQDLTIQREALERAGCAIIRAEKVSGTSTQGREELRTLLDFVREGDELVVTRVDRLARSIADLQDVMRELREKGATLRATEQPIDTSTAAGKAFLDMLGVFAEFEMNSPAFLRRLRISVFAAARSRPATAFRFGRVCASGCRTSRCSRTHPAWPLRVFGRSVA